MDSVSEMVERVAKALSPLAWVEGEYQLATGTRDYMREWSLQKAREAIESMREATRDMLLEGQSVVNLEEEVGKYKYISRDECQEIWATMIDEALKGIN